MAKTKNNRLTLLITGGTGFIGSHLIRRLVREGHTIISLQRRASSPQRIADCIHTITVYPIPDDLKLDAIFTTYPIDGVIHLATDYVKYPSSSEEIQRMTEANIVFPALLLDAAGRHNVSFFLNTGTCFEYEPTKEKISETSVIKPFNYYAATKLAFEELLKAQAREHGIPAATLKLFFPYGEQDNDKLFVILIRTLLHNEKIAISKGEQYLNYTYVSDIVDAYIKAISYLRSSQATEYQVFNIGSDEAITLKDAVILLETITGKTGIISLTKEYAEGEIMQMVSDNSKAKKVLNWNPTIRMEEGLRRMISYYQSV